MPIISFPPAPVTPPSPPAGVIARSIGAVNLNDRVNTFFDHFIPPSTPANRYEQFRHQRGKLQRITKDQTPGTVECWGVWIDNASLKFLDFVTALEGVDQGVLDLGRGWKWAAADVVEILPNRRGIVRATDGTAWCEVWDWSIKFQVYSAQRVP